MHIIMCMDMCADMCADMCTDMCTDICTDMCDDMCIDMRIDVCINTWCTARQKRKTALWREFLAWIDDTGRANDNEHALETFQ